MTTTALIIHENTNKDDFNRLQTSNQTILEFLRKDENSPSSDLYQRISSTTSNKTLPLYIEPDPTTIHSKTSYTQTIPLPPFLKKEITKAKVSSYNGLLPSANLAWFSVDDQVYVWQYNIDNATNNDFCTYKPASKQCITHVGLVKPKPNIFKSIVEWCLVITTIGDASLLAITFSNTVGISAGTATLQLHVTPFCMYTEFNPLYPIKGTDNGRIFLGGHDGSLYEMEYSVDDQHDSILGKFDILIGRGEVVRQPKKKCRKINHSEENAMYLSRIVPTFIKSIASTLSGTPSSSPIIDLQIDNFRQLIYTLNSSGTITCYKYDKAILCTSVLNVPYLAKQYLQCIIQSWISSPPSTSSQIQFVGSGKAISSNVHNVEGARKWLEACKSKKDVLNPKSIHVVRDYTSQFISLVAVTKSGLRYYFTFDCNSLLLCHVKAPPMRGDVDRFAFGYGDACTVNNTYWKDGVLVSSLDNANENVLMCIMPNCTLVQDESDGAVISPPSHTNSSEIVLYPQVTTSHTIPGGVTWDISSSVENKRDLLLRYLFHASTTPSDTDLTSTLPPPAFLTKTPIQTSSSETSLLSTAMSYIVGTLKRKRDDLLPIWTSATQDTQKYTFAESSLTEEWLSTLRAKSPSISSFHPLTTQHLHSDESFIVMNSNGVHVFHQEHILQQFKKALRNNETAKIHSFFHDYGFQEGCVMSLYIALTSESIEIKHSATRAALAHANSPKLNDESEFVASSLHDALISLHSRFIRPFWLKPIVVVENNTVHMLLDIELLHTLRKPLVSLQELMRDVFKPALVSVPQCPTQMDIEETFLMNAMHIQQSRETLSAVQKDSMAKYKEETSIHNLYRLCSKTIQFLNVFEMLMDFKHMVDWGLLHAVTCMQFVTSMEGHNRMQTLLLDMVTKEGVENVNRNLVRVLSKNAFLYFSAGDRYAYQGFDAVGKAKKDGGIWREQAGIFFCKAARFWKNPSLVVGFIEKGKEDVPEDSMDKDEQIAINHTSPLAKAAAALYSIENYHGIAELCLVTAANFGGTVEFHAEQEAVGTMDGVFPWEMGLYHRSAVQEENQLVVHGTPNETTTISPADARSTCYSILFYYLHCLLLKSSTEAEKILNLCVSTKDTHFQQMLFQYFVGKHLESLLRISSPSLEQYLIQKQDAMILYRYYIIHNRDADAANVMLEYGATTEELDLESRTDCLSRASMLLPSYSSQSSQVKQMLENLKIQAIILKRLNTSDQEVLKPLKTQLMDISLLLNEYAIGYQMYDVALRILNVCRIIDQGYIERLWGLLLGKWIPNKSQNGDVEELLRVELGEDGMEGTFDDASGWLSSFQSEFVDLGKSLYGTGADYTFPVGFLVRKLLILQSAHEEVTVSTAAPIWLLLSFFEIGVPFEKVLEALNDWLEILEQELGSSKKQRMDCLKNIANLLNHWVNTASSQQSRRTSIYDVSGNADASLQLNQSLAAGLLQKIQGWKTTTESMIGENTSNIYSTIVTAESLIKNFY